MQQKRQLAFQICIVFFSITLCRKGKQKKMWVFQEQNYRNGKKDEASDASALEGRKKTQPCENAINFNASFCHLFEITVTQYNRIILNRNGSTKKKRIIESGAYNNLLNNNKLFSLPINVLN